MTIEGGDINAILRLVRRLAPNDGDKQLSLLAYALAIAIRDLGVDRRIAIDMITRTLAAAERIKLEPLDGRLS